MNPESKITGETVRADFNAIDTVVHYARAAHFLGLWESERVLIERYFPDRGAALLEAGCGAGRATVGLWHLGYHRLTAFDFAEEMIDQAKSLASEHGITGIAFLHADATDLRKCHIIDDTSFDGALFLFNGLMQIPGRERRRAAMSELHRACRRGAIFIFTTHDRDADPVERAAWAREAIVWARGEQSPRLLEFGDRYFNHDHGCTFMHLPTRAEILEDLASTGWLPVADALRDELARERRAVRDFSDNCRFWVAKKN
ncbi:MAG TPA: class I SAM-dependent methyltransferase [Candidatus Didemnitutus sp.]|nr:class I SAM-dependent methyltransferase [Candidatus Didemnitutus sp.]